jgi:hypothetical protein
MACKHETPQWTLADCNEDGWQCAECSTKLGFRPDFDREHTLDKVETILFWLHEHDFIHVSNASEGDGMVASIARHCHETNTFDQQTIVGLVVSFGLTRHQEFWRTEAKQFFCDHQARELRGDKSVCIACGNEVKQADAGPLFAGMSKEPF